MKARDTALEKGIHVIYFNHSVPFKTAPDPQAEKCLTERDAVIRALTPKLRCQVLF